MTGVTLVTAAQLLLTYWPPLQRVFATAPVSLADGLAIVAVGVALLLVVEAEKRLVARFSRAPQSSARLHRGA